MKRVSRREVIKTFALGAAFSNVMGNGWAAALVYDIKAAAHNQTGLLEIRLSDFPELATVGGSVRIGTTPVVRQSADSIRATGIFQPFIINRTGAAAFRVLSAECTHAGCSVQRLNANGYMECPCHFSRFSIDGAVLRGPANQPLDSYAHTQVGDSLQVQVPNLFYEVKAERVPSASRVEVSFLGFSEIHYEVYFRTSLSAPLERVSFAVTPNGPLDQTELIGADDFATLYLEKPGAFGFFQVAMKTAEV